MGNDRCGKCGQLDNLLFKVVGAGESGVDKGDTQLCKKCAKSML